MIEKMTVSNFERRALDLDGARLRLALFQLFELASVTVKTEKFSLY